MKPPHLPPPSCDIKTHARLQHMPIVFLVLIISVLAGLSTALATIAWIAPPAPSDQFFLARGLNGRTSESALDPDVINQTRERMIALYDGTKKVNGAIYPEEARIGYAVLLTSDGWAVTRMPLYRTGMEKKWEGIDRQGILHRIERVYEDGVGKLLYIKFSGSGFRIVPFASPDHLQYGAPVWVFDGEFWRQAVLDGTSRVSTDKTYSLWRPEYFYRLRGDAPSGVHGEARAGLLAFTDRGEFAGVVEEHHLLIPEWIVEAQIPSILAKGTAKYPPLGLEGYFIHAIAGPQSVRPVIGFFLTRVSGKNVQTLAKVDIVLRIEGDLIDAESASRRILSSPDELTLTVLRNGQEKEAVVRKGE